MVSVSGICGLPFLVVVVGSLMFDYEVGREARQTSKAEDFVPRTSADLTKRGKSGVETADLEL